MLSDDLSAGREAVWRNPHCLPFARAAQNCPFSMTDIRDAEARLARFAAYFRAAFPETRGTGGILESPLRPIPAMADALERDYGVPLGGSLWIKLDSHLPISGSVKARGGIYEVLKTAEEIALSRGLIADGDDYAAFASPAARALFSEYSIAVGSTGNLGLSIGIMGAALGFRTEVHMSADARQWKKDLLRARGVRVVEYPGDYSAAVKQGREQAASNPRCHFVDDENSPALFLGYAVAALRLKEQLRAAGITVDEEHPLLVYLPCGVGGAPGGITFGLKQVFGDAVHCFFAEPTEACCMILGLSTGRHHEISVADIGRRGITAADGLAVGRPSGFVGKLISPFLDGCYTLSDQRMYALLARLADTEDLWLEPSALAGMYGPVLVETAEEFRPFASHRATHLVWATGGGMVPETEMMTYYRRGKQG